MRRALFVSLVLALTILLLPGSALATPKPEAGSGDGHGRVFFPNPVAQLQDQSLTDQKDADYAALQPAYRTVTLTDLDNSGYLSGRWAVVINAVGGLAYSGDKTFLYGRNDNRFEQVMAYYWVTESEKYIQSLGFGSSRRGINDHPQQIKINQFGGDNSFAKDQQATLTFGKGGVDDAEDAEVILHEYGHAIHFDQSPDFYNSDEAGSIGEGFADYWAVTVTNVIAPTPDAPCVADWDSVSYTVDEPHCLRRVDTDLHYPEDLNEKVHHDGQIWSRALWDIRQALGHVHADTLILTAQFDFPGTTMPDLAARTVAAAQALYGNAAANAVRDAFEDRGIL
ncbi:MAG: M36 family metallopeptidase [Actinomycetota bacterium]